MRMSATDESVNIIFFNDRRLTYVLMDRRPFRRGRLTTNADASLQLLYEFQSDRMKRKDQSRCHQQTVPLERECLESYARIGRAMFLYSVKFILFNGI